jgi:hypothetical protein
VGGSIYTITENAEALVVASKEIGLDVNADKTKYMAMSRDQNAGQRHRKGVRVHICGNNIKKSRFYSGRN